MARVGRLDALTNTAPERAPRPGSGVDAALAIVSAAIIAYGVLVLDWSVFIVMALFWFENVVIGGFNVLRMLVSGMRLGPVGLVGACALSAFFTLHYGLFTAVHGVFVVMLFGTSELGREAMNGGLLGPLQRMLGRLVTDRDGWLAMLAIVAVQAAAFVRWSIATRELPTPLKDLMGAPYGRIVVLHVTLIAGGFLVHVAARARARCPAAGRVEARLRPDVTLRATRARRTNVTRRCARRLLFDR